MTDFSNFCVHANGGGCNEWFTDFLVYLFGCCIFVFGCQYQCNRLCGKTRLQNDLLWVKWDVKCYCQLTNWLLCLCAVNKSSLNSGGGGHVVTSTDISADFVPEHQLSVDVVTSHGSQDYSSRLSMPVIRGGLNSNISDILEASGYGTETDIRVDDDYRCIVHCSPM